MPKVAEYWYSAKDRADMDDANCGVLCYEPEILSVPIYRIEEIQRQSWVWWDKRQVAKRKGVQK